MTNKTPYRQKRQEEKAENYLKSNDVMYEEVYPWENHKASFTTTAGLLDAASRVRSPSNFSVQTEISKHFNCNKLVNTGRSRLSLGFQEMNVSQAMRVS